MAQHKTTNSERARYNTAGNEALNKLYLKANACWIRVGNPRATASAFPAEGSPDSTLTSASVKLPFPEVSGTLKPSEFGSNFANGVNFSPLEKPSAGTGATASQFLGRTPVLEASMERLSEERLNAILVKLVEVNEEIARRLGHMPEEPSHRRGGQRILLWVCERDLKGRMKGRKGLESVETSAGDIRCARFPSLPPSAPNGAHLRSIPLPRVAIYRGLVRFTRGWLSITPEWV